MFLPWIMDCVESFLQPHEWAYLHYPDDEQLVCTLGETQYLHAIKHKRKPVYFSQNVANALFSNHSFRALDLVLAKNKTIHLHVSFIKHVSQLQYAMRRNVHITTLEEWLCNLDTQSLDYLLEVRPSLFSTENIARSIRNLNDSTQAKHSLKWFFTNHLLADSKLHSIAFSQLMFLDDVQTKDFNVCDMRLIEGKRLCDWSCMCLGGIEWVFTQITHETLKQEFIDDALAYILQASYRPEVWMLQFLTQHRKIQWNQDWNNWFLSSATCNELKWLREYFGAPTIPSAEEELYFDSLETYEWVRSLLENKSEFDHCILTNWVFHTMEFTSKQQLYRYLDAANVNCCDFMECYHDAEYELTWIIERCELKQETLPSDIFPYVMRQFLPSLPHRFIPRLFRILRFPLDTQWFRYTNPLDKLKARMVHKARTIALKKI